MRHFALITILLSNAGLWSACSPYPGTEREGETRLRVVATTTIVGDIVARIGADDIQLTVLLPPGADPHGYFFRPVDMTRAAAADLIFINGAGLEGHLDRLLGGVTHPERIVSMADVSHARCLHEHHNHAHDGEDDHHAGIDPHFWTDPANVMRWSTAIADRFAIAAPEHADAFHERAEALTAELAELSAWIEEQVATIPPERRLLVTDHSSMGYFADRYGFQELGVIIRSFDSMAQPSARDLAQLIRTLNEHRVPAIFISESVNPSLAEQVARDTGVQWVPLHSGSLSDPLGPVPDYFAYMRSNVEQIVGHLRPTPAVVEP